MCAHERKCGVARSRKYILCTPPVAFRELRLAGRENATKKQIKLDGGQILRVLSRTFFLKSATFRFLRPGLTPLVTAIDHLWSDHLSSCQLCSCHPFQFEDHERELHQDVEDH